MNKLLKGVAALAVAAGLCFFHSTSGPTPLTWTDAPQGQVAQ